MAIVGLVVAIPLTIIIRGGGGGSAVPNATTVVQPGGPPRQVVDGVDGIAITSPQGWSVSHDQGVISLRSPDRTVDLVLSAPAAAGAASTVLGDAADAVRSNYEDVTTVPGVSSRLAGRKAGGLPATSTLLSARSHGGTQMQVLLSAASGKSHTYLVELFTATTAAPSRLAEAQAALNTLKLTR